MLTENICYAKQECLSRLKAAIIIGFLSVIAYVINDFRVFRFLVEKYVYVKKKIISYIFQKHTLYVFGIRRSCDGARTVTLLYGEGGLIILLFMVKTTYFQQK